MKTNLIFLQSKSKIILLAVLFLSSLVLLSCKKDEIEEDPYFTIEGSPTGISVDMNGSTSSYTVRSNRPWQIVAQEEGEWARAFPDEGEDDGIFKFIVEENPTFEARTMNFAFVVDGEEQPVLFRIDQEAVLPYIIIPNSEAGISVPSAAGELSISIDANVPWTYSLDDDSWLDEISVSNSEIIFQVSRNWGDERSVTLSVNSSQYPGVEDEVVLTQSPGYVVFEEDFSWLTYGSTVPYEWENAVRYDSWTQEERDRGWDVTPNEYSSDQPCCYAMTGFVKLGKTSYGGDIISPKLNIEGTQDVKVSFKSAVYISAGGTVDDRVLKVFALNAGTPSVSEFTINNVPNSQAEDEAGIVNDIWDPARGYSFTITGATADTRIKFLGGDYYLVGIGQGKNRIFLDDIKVEIIQ